MNFKEAQEGPTAVMDLPALNEGGNVHMLWHSGFWDGPLSGMCMFNEREHWFECVSEEFRGRDKDNSPWFGRLFVVVSLTDEQIAEHRRRHDLFREHVGTHTDYTYEGGRRHRQIGAVHPRETHQLFYDQSKSWPAIDHSNNEVAGWWGVRMFDFDQAIMDKMGDVP